MSNLAKRFLTAGVAIPLLVLFIFFLPGWTLMIPASLAIFVGSMEVMRMIAPVQNRFQSLAGTLAVVAFCCLCFYLTSYAPARSGGGHPLLLASTAAAVGLLLLLGLVFYKPLETAGARLAGLFLTLFYPGLLLTFIVIIHNTFPNGHWWTFCILLTAFLCDTGAYFAGRLLGKHPLAPRLSPKKTLEGVGGGLVGALTATLVAHFLFLHQVPLIDAIVLGVAGCAACVAGDLVESLLKRAAGIKDAGKFFPGHGGMMDRIDGLLLVTIVFYLYLTFRY